MAKRVFAEFLGTGILVTVVVGSGAMAQNLSQDIGLQLLINTVATILALGLLIELIGPLSGAHFNPLVSIIRFALRKLSLLDAFAYIMAQFFGGIAGVMLANVMFSHPAISMSHHARSGFHIWLGEVVATAGLIFVIFQAIAQEKSKFIPILVPAWIGAAYFFTSSTSFANPAVTLSRSLTNTFSGIKPSSVAGFFVAQIIGAVIGYFLVFIFDSTKEVNRA
jgi:glycerol uptake facilitator-like aquaporin